ncbi:MAG: GNAT family N-acetyltransferase [Pseudomonadota bacterium]
MVELRAFEKSDADAVWSMLEPVFRAGDTYAIDPRITRQDALRYWTAHESYVAEIHGQCVGTFYIRPNQQGGGAHICNCGYITARGSEGKGVARAMLAHSLEDARLLGFKAMQYNFVLATNKRAIHTWLRAGFAEIGRIPEAFLLPNEEYTDALILHRFL